MFTVKQIIYSILIFFAALLTFAMWPLTSVPTGSRGVLTEFGAIKRIEPEGLVFVAPWQKVSIFSIRAEQSDVNDAVAATFDQQPVETSLTVRYSISPDKVSEVFEQYSHNGDLSNYVQTAVQEVFKAVSVKYTAVEMLSKRAQVSNDIQTALQAKLDKYGASVINIDMRNFKFTQSYMDAINQKTTQEQLKLAAENQVKTVEAQQRAKVVTAEAEAAAVKATADGNAYANLKLAQASAESLRIQNEALSKNKDVLELRRVEVEQIKAQKWDGKLPVNIYASAPIPFLQTEK